MTPTPSDQERQFQLLVDSIKDYAIFMLDPDGHVTSWNSGAQRIKGYRPDEILGRNFSEFYTDEDRAAGVPAQLLVRAAESGRAEAEGWRVRKDGSWF
jgi:PAS domain S-box-containing protein